MAAWSDASAGDLRPSGPVGDLGADSDSGSRTDGESGTELGAWASALTGPGFSGGGVVEVHWVNQVHGTAVITVPDPTGTAGPGRPPGSGLPVVLDGPGDALVSSSPSVALAVLTADCASVALGSPEGVFAAVHAGWRGLLDGVVPAAVGTMRRLGATEVVGALGPCIHAECYEFAEPDLAAVCAVVGETARAETADGRPALDIPAAVSSVLAASGVRETPGARACTACQGSYFSHRRRRDPGRQALLVWSGPTPTPAPAPAPAPAPEPA